MSIHQEVVIKADTKSVYDIFVSSQLFTAMTGGAEANISDKEGGVVSLFGGRILARNIELVPGKRVVQSWRAASWPEGVHSIVRFELSDAGGGTKIVLDQDGYPDDAKESLVEGWTQMYWGPMEAMLAAR